MLWWYYAFKWWCLNCSHQSALMCTCMFCLIWKLLLLVFVEVVVIGEVCWNKAQLDQTDCSLTSFYLRIEERNLTHRICLDLTVQGFKPDLIGAKAEQIWFQTFAVPTTKVKSFPWFFKTGKKWDISTQHKLSPFFLANSLHSSCELSAPDLWK